MPRICLPMNQDWYFEEYPKQLTPPFRMEGEPVHIPHTWNKDSSKEYHRGACRYTRELRLDDSLRGKELYLEFRGVNSTATVYLNDTLLGIHKGGYSIFRYSISDSYQWQEKNILCVIADNSESTDVSPLFGDFTIYGGIYRDVNLIAVSPLHFELLSYGTLGVKVITEIEKDHTGRIHIESAVCGTGAESVVYQLHSADGQIVAEKEVLPEETSTVITIPYVIRWNGKENPYLYTLTAILNDAGGETDRVELVCGFREFEMTADKGLLLNGKKLPLHGVGIHQDFEGAGNAVSRAQREADFRLIHEMGCNMVRLTHYQHASYIYDICDRDGYVVWSEIPMLNMTEAPELLENAREQLRELILQNCHHPSILCWGIQNEIAMFGESKYMVEGTKQLNEEVKRHDPTRYSACANLHNVKPESDMNTITDMVGYNIYYGWYYGEIPEYQTFFEEFHSKNPEIPLGVSEYGVDCNLSFHTDHPKKKDYTEEYQTVFHEQVYAIIEKHDFLWGSVIWNMFDFGSAIRDEGGTKGKNSKGLVSFDRKVKKDAFYFYKACWSTSPFVHITGRRYEKRSSALTDIKVYSSRGEVSLYVNGRIFESKTGYRIFVFHDVPLCCGENRIEAKAEQSYDEIILKKVEQPCEGYTYIDPNPGFNVKNWFLKDNIEISTDESYSLWDTVGDLMESEDAWRIVKEDLPELWKDPSFEKRIHYVLFKLINRTSGRFREEKVKEVNRKLMEIKKKEKQNA